LNQGHFGCFTFIFCIIWKSCLLVLWCSGGRCGMACSDKDFGRSRRPGAKDRGWSHMSCTLWSGDREVGWHRVRSAPCMWRRGARVSWLSMKTKVDGLSVVWSQNHWDDFSGLASKPVGTVSWLILKTKVDGLSVVWPQNQACFGLSVATQNRREDASVRDTYRDLAACFV
jgi:hypothetical protein